MRYEILEGNMERLEKKLNAIRHKCEKHGCEFRFEVVGETFREIECGYEKFTARFVVVEAEGTAKMNGWEFIATLDHTKTGNIIRSIGEHEVPERFYYTQPICEHCNSKRTRKNTYIVRNTETGEFKQVGKSCLKEFTNGLSAEAVAQYISWFDEIIKGTAPFTGSVNKPYYKTETMLRYAAETVLKFGYVPSSAIGRNTVARVFSYYRLDNGLLPCKVKETRAEMEEANFDVNDPEAVKLAQETMEWVNAHADDTNYFHNLKVALSAEYVTGRELGLICSAIPAYNRELEYRERKAREEAEGRTSEYYGSVGDRVTVKMTSIKAHTEYRGVKQTELTRCKVA